ncbi:MAG: UPF0182 family protein [Capsulimonadales bacterium]|nr:UPF0182 family protein [Capsulimonadales bacterium]
MKESRGKLRQRSAWIAAGFLVVFLFFSHRIAVTYTDWLWFRELATESVFVKVYGTRVFLFCVFGATSFALAYFNVWLADRISPPSSVPTGGKAALFPVSDGKPIGRTMRTLSGLRYVLDALLLVGAFVFAVFAGFSAQEQWDEFLRFTHPEPFHVADPQFGHDIGFYVFTLPFLRFVQGWSLTITLLIGAGVALVYLYQQGINRASGNMIVLPHVRSHLSVIVGIAFLLQAIGHLLDRYALLVNYGSVVGAFFTEIHAKLPLYQAMCVIAILAAVASFVNFRLRTLYIPMVSLVVWLGFQGLSTLWPPIFYRLQVIPNEAALEAPYFSRALRATQTAYGLDRIQVREWEAKESPAVKASDDELLANFPVREEEILAEELSANQGFRRFVAFSQPRTDRYRIDGRETTVQIATREINSSQLDPRAYTWTNLHLRYTHGMGAVVAAGTAAGGTPDYLLSGLPPISAHSELTLTEPHLYFGNTANLDDYVVVNALLPELAFGASSSASDEPHRYAGTAGIRLTPLTRIAFAVRYAALSLALSREVTAQSRLLFNRNIAFRLKKIAPFLLLDSTSCPVIYDGRLVWIQNAFTTTNAYPYSAFSMGRDNVSPASLYNYIRPSVMAVIDGYDGKVTLYVTDEQDPILRSYQRTFPNLFRPLSEMPTALRRHRRYPRDLFLAQRRILTEYHSADPVAFYSRTNIWRLPQTEIRQREPGKGAAGASAVSGVTSEQRPYFGLTRLEENGPPEFVALTPFTPEGKSNLTALLVARSDEPHFGELILYRFGSRRVTPGPEQIARRIRTAPPVAPAPPQWTAMGDMEFGSVRVIPVAGKRLYYLQGLFIRPNPSDSDDTTTATPPQLRQIAVATPSTSGFAPTVREAFRTLLPPPPITARSPISDGAPLIRRANSLYDRAQAALRGGDFAAYGRLSQELGRTLRQLENAVAGNAPVETPGGKRP